MILINLLLLTTMLMAPGVLPRAGVLRMRIFKGVEKAIVYVKGEKNEKCCGVEMSEGVWDLSLKNCENGINCNGEMIQEYTENTCKYGYPYGTICGKVTLNGTGHLCKHKIECACDPVDKEFFCDSLYGSLGDVECPRVYKYSVNNDNELVKNLDGSVKLGTIMMPVCTRDSTIKMKNHYVKESVLFVELKSSDQSSCDINIGKTKCTYVCEGTCLMRCKLPDNVMTMRKAKIRVSVRCDDWQEKIWLFRDSGSNLYTGIYSQSRWTSLREDLTELLLVDILAGYFIITFIIYTLVYIVTHIGLITKYIKKLYRSFFQSTVDSPQGDCCYCQMRLVSLEDAYLHDEYCPSETCPYCGISVEASIMHVRNCKKRESALSKTAEEIREAESEEGKILRRDFKRNVLMKLFTYNTFTYKLWLVTIFALTLSCLIIPSSGELTQPCSKSLGETANCQANIMKAIHGNSIDHHHWTAIELGLYDKIETKLLGSAYQMNKVARMKLDESLFNGRTDPETMIGEVSDCNTQENVCRYSSTIEWTGDVCEGSQASYETKDENIFDNSLHLLMMGVEMKVTLEHQYDTACFKVKSNNIFTCTGTCELCETENKCVKKTFRRAADTSWTHNPADCLSINAGCTCNNVEIVPDFEKDTMSVYKTMRKEMSAVICIEYNNIFIDCELIRDVNSYKLGQNILHVNTWDMKFDVPDYIIVKNNLPSNNFIKTAYVGGVCKRNSCRMGEFGDVQFKKGTKNCEESIYVDPSDIKGELMYSFAKTPRWNIEVPQCGAKMFETFTPLTDMNEFTNHYVNMSDETIVIDGGCIGKFSLKMEITDVRVHKRVDDAVIDSFSVDYCSGEHGSMLGAVCTFTVVMKGTPKGTIRMKASDTLIIQDDSQAIEEGKNVFRKFMYVRGSHPGYQFCYEFMDKSGCSYAKNNFTDPKESFVSKSEHTIPSDRVKIVNNCNDSYTPYCMWVRFRDLLSSIKRILYLIIIIFVMYHVFKLLWWLFKKYFTKEYEGVVDRTEMILNKIRKFKERGYKRRYN